MTKFYITTSIPYVNASPHIGFALEAVQADVIARWHRLHGEDVYFLTGTDEHGAKIVKAAAAAGTTPEEFTGKISDQFRNLAKALNISTDDFIRTSDQQRHWPGVKAVWEKLKGNGDLYKKEYEGLYCVGCEAFITKKDLEDDLCKIHKKKPEVIKEENWFFRLSKSKYSEDIREAIESGQLRIVPDGRKNEMLEFIKEGLQDVSFSRPRKDLQWGVPVPEDDTSTIYVWADALVNYLSGLGYPDGENFKKYWPADVHVVGKDILRFHATIWPAMLLALGLPLPKTIFVHGFITVGGQKMSKSLGNVVDPFPLIEKYGADAVRYFLLREIPPAEDGDFTQEKFEGRYNADLASGLGNLVARVFALSGGSFKGSSLHIKDKQLNDGVVLVRDRYDQLLREFRFNEVLEQIWSLISLCDKHIEQKRPWERKEGWGDVWKDLDLVLFNIAEFLEPFLPDTADKIREQLGSVQKMGGEWIFAPQKGKPLFPRIET